MAAAIGGLHVIPALPSASHSRAIRSRLGGGRRHECHQTASSLAVALRSDRQVILPTERAKSGRFRRGGQLRGRCRSSLGEDSSTRDKESDESLRTAVRQPPTPAAEPHVNGASSGRRQADGQAGGGEKGAEVGERAGNGSSAGNESGQEGGAGPGLLGSLVEKVVEVASEAGDVLESTAETVAAVGELDLALPEDAGPLAPTDEAADVFDRDALTTVGFWVSAATLFGVVVGVRSGLSKASEFFAGYLLEQSLSVDNLFVFVLIFSYFKVPINSQKRVLTYGIAGAVVFRGLLIGLGGVALQSFEALNLAFAAVLLFSSYKLLTGSSDDEDDDLTDNFLVKLCRRVIPVSSTYDEDRFWTVENGSRMATPLLLTLAVVELSDVAFAVDSIPAVFGVTRDPYIVFSSNIFAILGLRSLYTLISGSLRELDYLQPTVAVVLGFIGVKMVADFLGSHISTEVSLAVVATFLGGGLFLSLRYPPKDK